MNRKKILFIVCSLLLSSLVAQAQFNRRLERAVERSAERAVIRQAERRTERAVNKAIDDAIDGPKTNQGNNNSNTRAGANNQATPAGGNANQNAPAQTGASQTTVAGGNSNQTATPATPEAVKSAELAYSKSDFVPGDEIFFDDNTANEKMGEFPSQWDLNTGNAEIAMINGEKCISLIGQTIVIPLMNPSDNYLPDEFTIEFDVFGDVSKGNKVACEMGFKDGKNIFIGKFYHMDDRAQNPYRWLETVNVDKPRPRTDRTFVGRFVFRPTDAILSAIWFKPDESKGEQIETIPLNPHEWQHVSISFNKRALKYYVNGVRILNVPNMIKPTSFWFWAEDGNAYFKDLRIAKGAVPLYDRMTSSGKIITYGITFDVGKSTVKPESMTEIMRFVALMKENPDLRFSVEGHTDNTGSAASNQTLSEARSQAVVDKLAENGIARDRLTAAGKGQNSPLADNSTDEGRAKNRRMEFVKL